MFILKSLLANLIVLLSSTSGALPKEALVNSVVGSLPQAEKKHEVRPVDKGLEEEVKNFSSLIFSIPKENITIKEHSYQEDITESGAGDTIYFIYDEMMVKVGVVKTKLATKEDRSSLSNEAHVLEQLGQIKFSRFHAVEILGYKSYKLGDERHEFFAMSVAKGKTFNSYLKTIGSLPLHHPKRTQLYEDLKVAMKQSGSALSELHKKRLSHKIDSQFEKKRKKIERDYNKINGTNIKLSQLPIAKGPSGLIHGDLHPGNLFFDPVTKQVTFIDFQSMQSSLVTGGPVASDLANFHITFEAAATYHHLKKKEIKELLTLFDRAYQEKGPNVSQKSIDLYTTLLSMEFISQYNNAKEEWAEEQVDMALAFKSHLEKKLHDHFSSSTLDS